MNEKGQEVIQEEIQEEIQPKKRKPRSKQGKGYTHLGYPERRRIEFLYGQNYDTEQIAKTLGYTRGSIHREIERNSVSGIYSARVAQRLAENRKRQRFLEKTKLTKELFYEIKGMLALDVPVYKIAQRIQEQGYDVAYSTVHNWVKQGQFERVPDKDLI